MRSILNLTTLRLTRELENLKLNKSDVKQIFDELESGTKSSYNQAMSEVLGKTYDESYKVNLNELKAGGTQELTDKTLPTKSFANFKARLESEGVASQDCANFLNFIEKNIYNDKGVSFTQLNNALKNLNSYYKEAKDPNFKSHIKQAMEGFIRRDIKAGIDAIFAQNKTAYKQASSLYESALQDYANMKATLKLADKLKIRNATTEQNKALESLLKLAKGQGDKSDNITALTKALDKDNRAVIEMNMLQKLFTKSLYDDGALKVLDSGSFFRELESLTKGTFQSKEAQDFIHIVKGFDTLFKNDVLIAKALRPATTGTIGSSIATSIEGAMRMQVVKNAFSHIVRLMPHIPFMSGLNQKVQGAALRYHLQKALESSFSISELKHTLTQAISKKPYTSQTKSQIDKIIKGIDKAQDELMRAGEALSAIHMQREQTKTALNELIGKDIINQNDGRIAQVSKKNIAKMISDKAIQKSMANGFSPQEHFNAVQDIENLYKNAQFKQTHGDLKHGDEAIQIHRYTADIDTESRALITIKESLDKDKSRVYSLELEGLESRLHDMTPEKTYALDSYVKDFDTSGSPNMSLHTQNPTIKPIKTEAQAAIQKESAEASPALTTPNLESLQAKIQQIKQQITESKNPDKEYLHQILKPDEIIALEKQYFNQEMPKAYKELMQDFPQLYEQTQANALKTYTKDTDKTKEISQQLLNEFANKPFKDTAKRAELLLFNELRGKAQELGFKELDINAPSFQVAFKKFQTKLKKGDIQDLSEYIAPRVMQRSRADIEEALNIKPLAEFGKNYAEFFRDGMGAVEKLMQEKQGQVAGAFYREELGDIDLVWGEVTGKGKGYGLAHILEKHPDFDVLKIPEIIESGKIEKTYNGYNIITDDYIVGLNKGWKDEVGNTIGDNVWIVTSFEPRKHDLKKGAGSIASVTSNYNEPMPQKPLADSTTNPTNMQNMLESAPKTQGESLDLYDTFIENNKIKEGVLNSYAKKMPQALNEQEFLAQIPQTNHKGYSTIQIPIGEMQINLQHAWNHLNKGNTYKKDRSLYSGAFLDTLTDPLFIVKQEYIPNPRVSANARENANSKLVQNRDTESIAQDSYVFFKPYKIKDKYTYMVGYALDIEGNIVNTTFIPMSVRDFGRIKKMFSSEVLYFKG